MGSASALQSVPWGMRRVRALLLVFPPLLMICIAGCNCDGNVLCTKFTSPSTSTSSTAGSAAGIWTGTDSATNLELTGYVDANGQADFIRSDGVQFIGTAQVSGTTLNIALNGYTQYGYDFPDGSAFGTGSFSGSFESGSTLSGSVDFTTAGGTTIDSSWSLTFDSLYDTASSLDTISGTYTDNLAAVTDGVDPLGQTSLTISSTGVLYAQGSADGCVANGSVTLVSAGTDLYQVSYTLENCTGSEAVLNDVAFSGLAELNTDASPEALVLAVTGASSSGAYYGIVSELTGS